MPNPRPTPKLTAKPKKPRAKREPSALSIAVKSVNLVQRKQTLRDKLAVRIEALDAQIVELQNSAAENMKVVNDIIYGPDSAPSEPPAGA